MTTATTLVIRRAQPGDTPVLLELVARYWAFEGLTGFEPAAVGAPLQRLLSTPALGAAWLASSGKQPLGYLILAYVFSLEHQGLTAEIDEFFVEPGHRSCGVGAKLLKEAEAESARQGCTGISLRIAVDNDRARDFYRRHGYSHRSAFEILEKTCDLSVRARK